MPQPDATPHPAPKVPLRNTESRWGLIAVALHWGVAAVVFGLFALGLWMTSLSYYDPWYKQGPDLHRAIGVVLFIAVVARLVWRWIDPAPARMQTHARWEVGAAHIAHTLLYVLMLTVMVSGYLISTADGRSIKVFGLFSVPATLTSLPQQEDIAGVVHLSLAIALIVLAVVHALGAVKHHVLDKDATLVRMFARAHR